MIESPTAALQSRILQSARAPDADRSARIASRGEKSVNELQAALEIDQSSVSRQLAVLRTRNIVEDRKEGTTVYYRVRDPAVFQLLDVAREIFNNHLIDTHAMLQQLADEETT